MRLNLHTTVKRIFGLVTGRFAVAQDLRTLMLSFSRSIERFEGLVTSTLALNFPRNVYCVAGIPGATDGRSTEGDACRLMPSWGIDQASMVGWTRG